MSVTLSRIRALLEGDVWALLVPLSSDSLHLTSNSCFLHGAGQVSGDTGGEWVFPVPFAGFGIPFVRLQLK